MCPYKVAVKGMSFMSFALFSNNEGSSFTAYCGDTDIKEYMIMWGFKFEN